jgi:hypothetical protein
MAVPISLAIIDAVPTFEYTILGHNNFGVHIDMVIDLPENCSPNQFTKNSTGTTSANITCSGKMASLTVVSAACSNYNCHIFVNEGFNKTVGQDGIFACRFFDDMTTQDGYSYGGSDYGCDGSDVDRTWVVHP